MRWRTIPAFTEIGTTGKSHGSTGEVRIHVNKEFLESAMKSEFLFIKHQGSVVPYPVRYWREHRGLIVKFDGLETPAATADLVGRPLLLPSDEVTAKEGEQSVLHYAFLEGYMLKDVERGTIGKIESVEEYPQQEMAVISHQDDHLLIPLNQTFIAHIDEAQKTVWMNLPEGLTSL